MASDAELQRLCAPLYASFALESLASISLFFFFSYLSILISSKQQLKTPARSMCRFVCYHFTEWVTDTARILSKWDRMDEMDLGQRFRYCRRLNATICRFSAAAALLSVTRWLHVNNVNGFRYLGYAVTCPLMQSELVLLIAPVVPNYSGMYTRTCIATFMMLVCGYISSQFEGKLWDNDFNDILSGNLLNINPKGWFVLPSALLLMFLSFVQIPYLAFLYCVNGGTAGGLPGGYLTLLLITSVTWLGFPIWWFLSYEGMSIIADTKLNGVGFVLLNVISKGGFTLQMMSMVKAFKRSNPPSAGGNPQLKSMNTLPNFDDEDEEEEEAHARRMKQMKTGQSLDWMIKGLRKWDSEDAEGHHHGEQSAQLAPLATEQEIQLDTSRISDEQMMHELARRMHLQGHFDKGLKGDLHSDDSHQQSIDEKLRLACSQFMDEVEDDDM